MRTELIRTGFVYSQKTRSWKLIGMLYGDLRYMEFPTKQAAERFNNELKARFANNWKLCIVPGCTCNR